MRLLVVSCLSLLVGAALGGAAVAARAPTPATVVSLDAAEHRVAGSGKAEVRLLARGDNAFVGRLEMAGGAAVPAHRDPTEEYIHVLEGSGTLTIDGQEHALKPGDTVFMPANAEVSYRNGEGRMVAVQVFAGPEPAGKYDAWEKR